MKITAVSIVTLGLVGLGAWLSMMLRVEMSSEPLAQEVYVWQQHWSDPTYSSLENNARQFANRILLVAEIHCSDAEFTVKDIDLPLRQLSNLGVQFGMAIRVGTSRGTYSLESPAAQAVPSVIRRCLTEWRAAGLEPSEVQIDFDCPESKLNEYRDWLPTLRPILGGARLTFTALPSWLDQSAFEALAQVSDGYVLQVHFYQTPEHPSAATTLCDPDAAIRFVNSAARFGKPFRVALPTYGYRVFFGKDDRALGIAAEGSSGDWSEARMVRELHSNADELAGLVSSWKQLHPSALRGIIWFRMPVPGDELNWSWPVLNAVMQGRTPSKRLTLRSVIHNDGLVELVATNAGEADVALPTGVNASWQEGNLIAADGINSYVLTNRTPNRISLSGSQSKNLSAGERRSLAWLRFEQPTEVQIE